MHVPAGRRTDPNPRLAKDGADRSATAAAGRRARAALVDRRSKGAQVVALPTAGLADPNVVPAVAAVGEDHPRRRRSS